MSKFETAILLARLARVTPHQAHHGLTLLRIFNANACSFWYRFSIRRNSPGSIPLVRTKSWENSAGDRLIADAISSTFIVGLGASHRFNAATILGSRRSGGPAACGFTF